MRLSYKIFLGICIPSIVALILVSRILIYRSFSNDINNETVRCIQEYRIIEGNIENALKNSTSSKQTVLSAYSDYYRNNGIYFAYYEDNKKVYTSKELPEALNTQILNVDYENYLTYIQNEKDEHFLLISSKINDSEILIYARNVNSIYEIRNNLISLTEGLTVAIIFIVAIIAYFVSKNLSKPLDKMQDEMKKLSMGDYNINLKENNTEFGRLAKSFNKMSKELENRNNELIDMVNSKQTFIDNLSHEINTPLTSILGYAELLEKAECTDEQRTRFLLNIQKEAKRIKDIHRKLLLLSYKRNADFEMKTINAGKIFKEVQAIEQLKLKEHNINLTIENKAKEFYGDSTLIVMCISNIISNAINASKDGSKIKVYGYEDDKNVYVKIIDEGQGISKENIDKIVEPFYRVDKARSRKNGGAGLGLSICTSIMNLHKGKMRIESEIGKGSIFCLEFPKNLQL